MLIFIRHADIHCNFINNLDNIINMKNITQAPIRWAASRHLNALNSVSPTGKGRHWVRLFLVLPVSTRCGSEGPRWAWGRTVHSLMRR